MTQMLKVEVVVKIGGKSIVRCTDEADAAEYAETHFTWLLVGMLEHAKAFIQAEKFMVAVDKDGNEMPEDTAPPPPEEDLN